MYPGAGAVTHGRRRSLARSRTDCRDSTGESVFFGAMDLAHGPWGSIRTGKHAFFRADHKGRNQEYEERPFARSAMS